MNKESLTKAKETIIKALGNSNIDLLDKLELIINLNILLDKDNYEEDIKILKLHKNKSRN